MAIGIVKFFNTQKGYGFIGPSDGSRDESGMSNLREGQRVTYEVVTE
jgi:CspA family cold shock protein